MTNKRKKLIAIVGPTASGKTAIAVKLAKKFNGEIVSADSRQVYRGLDLGTGKDLAEYDGVKYHLIDIKDPGEEFHLFEYLKLARKTIEDIFSRGKLPIIVGGTGLYVQGLVEGFQLQETRDKKQDTRKLQAPNFKLQITGMEQLSKLTVEQLQGILREIDQDAFDKLADPKNPHRLIRAIQRTEEGIEMIKKTPDWNILQIGISWPKDVLDERIDRRVDDRFKMGMLEEVISLLKSGVDPEWLLKLGLEYKIITQYVLARHSREGGNPENLDPRVKPEDDDRYEQMKNLLKLRSHQYAKRQMTWFKRFPEIVWENELGQIKEIVEEFLR